MNDRNDRNTPIADRLQLAIRAGYHTVLLFPGDFEPEWSEICVPAEPTPVEEWLKPPSVAVNDRIDHVAFRIRLFNDFGLSLRTDGAIAVAIRR
jgi:hypothetical protein